MLCNRRAVILTRITNCSSIPNHICILHRVAFFKSQIASGCTGLKIVKSTRCTRQFKSCFDTIKRCTWYTWCYVCKVVATIVICFALRFTIQSRYRVCDKFLIVYKDTVLNFGGLRKVEQLSQTTLLAVETQPTCSPGQQK